MCVSPNHINYVFRNSVKSEFSIYEDFHGSPENFSSEPLGFAERSLETTVIISRLSNYTRDKKNGCIMAYVVNEV